MQSETRERAPTRWAGGLATHLNRAEGRGADPRTLRPLRGHDSVRVLRWPRRSVLVLPRVGSETDRVDAATRTAEGDMSEQGRRSAPARLGSAKPRVQTAASDPEAAGEHPVIAPPDMAAAAREEVSGTRNAPVAGQSVSTDPLLHEVGAVIPCRRKIARDPNGWTQY